MPLILSIIRYCRLLSFIVPLTMITVDAQNNQVCLNLPQQAVPSSESLEMRGRDGKRGPQGASGPQGTTGLPGPPGTCQCDLSEVENLKLKIRTLERNFRNMNFQWTTFYNNIDRVAVCPLGLTNGKIPNSDISSSTNWPDHEPYRGRLDAGGNNAWVPRRDVRNHPGQWIQVDLKMPTYLTAVVTQGRPNYDEWLTSFKISYGNSTNALRIVKDRNGNDLIFRGNSDRNTHVINDFPIGIFARYIRLITHTYHQQTSLRLEYLTC
ncbi:retinoschisin-like [Clavelina lepadiformis]|uniref:F5/8 type C domain-containing protein n=1 Tax=Clavelina lepadiformis TaxID=159417 RepID=A0ABP0FXN1_CLALP